MKNAPKQNIATAQNIQRNLLAIIVASSGVIFRLLYPLVNPKQMSQKAIQILSTFLRL